MTSLFTRKKAANYLGTQGLRSSQSSLARLAMTGEGPKYTLIGRTAYYKHEWLDEWLESQITPHSHSLAHMLVKNEGGS